MDINSFFNKYDRYGSGFLWLNPDGKLDKLEFNKMKKDLSAHSAFPEFETFDKNNDNKISSEEFHWMMASYRAQLGIELIDLQKFDFINHYLPKQITEAEDLFKFLQEAITYDESAVETVLQRTNTQIWYSVGEDKKAIFDFFCRIDFMNELGYGLMKFFEGIMSKDDATETFAAVGFVKKAEGILRLEPAKNFNAESLLTVYRPRLTDIQYMFLKNSYPDKDFRELYAGETPISELEKLAADCKALQPSIDYVERFADYAELRAIVDTRNNRLDSEQKIALIIFNKNDPNCAFEMNEISKYRSAGYQVCYYEVSSDQELEDIFSKTYYCNTDEAEDKSINRPIDVVVFGGHGMTSGISFSMGNITIDLAISDSVSLLGIVNIMATHLSLPGFSQEELDDLYLNIADENLLRKFEIFNKAVDNAMFDISDKDEMQKLNRFCAKDGVIVLMACLTGAGRKEQNSNLANTLARSFPEQTIYAPVIATKTPEIETFFTKLGNFFGMYFSNNPEDTYVVRASELQPLFSVPEEELIKIVDPAISEEEYRFLIYSSEDWETLKSKGLKISRDEEFGLLRIEPQEGLVIIHNILDPEPSQETRGYFRLGGPLSSHIEIVVEDGVVLVHEINKVVPGMISSATAIGTEDKVEAFLLKHRQ